MALLCEDKVSQAEIGRRLGVCKSTVSRELRRNRSVDGYQPAVAQKLSTSRRKAAGKRGCIRIRSSLLRQRSTGCGALSKSAPLAISSETG
ncbi:hypothetical protein EWM60_08160 [Candidatus Erwinia dacicola]|nr:hypothetical protein [Candidatus Erwinia dacicola]